MSHQHAKIEGFNLFEDLSDEVSEKIRGGAGEEFITEASAIFETPGQKPIRVRPDPGEKVTVTPSGRNGGWEVDVIKW